MVCPFQISRLTFRELHVLPILVPLISSSTREMEIRGSLCSNFQLFLVTTLQPLVRPSVTGSNEAGRDRAAGEFVSSTLPLMRRSASALSSPDVHNGLNSSTF